jgi:glycosyltransferase involved in cell wall biosynthesis
LVSIITPSCNQGKYIDETIRSVLGQTYGNVEYIVIDGASTDGTVEVLKRYDGQIRWISEKDRGQADAVNKGFAMASGDILGWLNSDDTYAPDAVSRAARCFADNPDVVMVYGDAEHIDAAGRVINRYPSEPFILNRLSKCCFISQPSVFIRKKVFDEVGPLDTALQTAMDYDYWCRIGKRYGEKRIAYLKGQILAKSRLYNENKTVAMRKIVYRESMRIQRKYFGRASVKWALGYFKQFILGIRFKV